jgi:hypothetical protein
VMKISFLPNNLWFQNIQHERFRNCGNRFCRKINYFLSLIYQTLTPLI